MSHSVRPSGTPHNNAAATVEEEACFPVEEDQTGEEERDHDEDLGQEDSGEVQAARKLGQPRMPSEKERREHDATHCPFRSWCEHCCRGQGVEYGHCAVVGAAAEEEVPRVIVDYCFITDNEPTRTEPQAESDDESLTALVMKETMCSSVWAYALKSKSVAEDPWVADQLVDDMCTIGMARERVVIKSDQEASIVELQSEVAKRRGFADYGVGTGIENSKVGDSNSNGKIERAIRDVKGMIRTLKSASEANI